jgi:3-phenylpropionate/trans-cinnamate dioxygenase ferredoxin reductase component
MTKETFVIIGAGHAGGRAAQAMRQHGFTGQIKLIGEEAYPPYERPPLSKELLYSDEPIEKAQLHDLAWYEDQNIDLILGNGAKKIDPAAKLVVLADDSEITYSKLLLTTGARVRKLPLPGADLDGVFYIRDFSDTLAVRARLQAGVKVVVIGGGFIGLESAASAAKRGCDVTVLEAADNLMGRSVAPEIGSWFVEMHRTNGVKINTGANIVSIDGEETVSSVTLEGEPAVPADLVIIGIGILPNVELAEAAGLEIDNGIVVDAAGRTSVPDIFAAGDVANQPNAFLNRRIRLESYQNAQDQAMAVARVMCGDEETYEDSLWVWSDQHDVNLQMTGIPDTWDELIWRGNPAEGSFMVFYMRDGEIIAVNTINNGREMRAAQRLMQSGKRYTATQLSDVSVRLLKLAKE